MKKICLAALLAVTLIGSEASAHFGMVIPSKEVVSTVKEGTVQLDLAFWHPFENIGMDLQKPKSFKVITASDGKSEDISNLLVEKQDAGFKVWQAEYAVKKPGLYAFVMEPAPYFEPEEDIFIIHHTKAYVAAFGDGEGWDKPLGVRAEIVPQVKPFALYQGNVFQGQVLLDGKPVPGAQVEVEFSARPDKVGVAPHDMMVTQTVCADQNGVFSYAAPHAGWWGFAALLTAPETLDFESKPKEIELGAVMWVYFNEPFKLQPKGKP